jgi:arylformamidase
MICLSYSFTEKMPVYGGTAGIDLKPGKSIPDGDSCNTWSFRLENHWGTHVDCPNHFFKNGKKLLDYPFSCWKFDSPQIIDVVAEPGQLIVPDDLQDAVLSSTDFLILRSGWGKLRSEMVYSSENPGIHSDFAFWLRKRHPDVRTLGIDWISVSSYLNRAMGRETHKAFLDPEGFGNPVLLVEDMNLNNISEKINSVFIAPVLIDKVDSAPCTIFALV